MAKQLSNNIYLYIIKLLYKSFYYKKYNKYIDSKFFKDNNPELSKIFLSLCEFHSKYPDKDIGSTELGIFTFLQYPAISNKEKDTITTVLDKLDALVIDEALADEYVKRYTERYRATRLALESLKVSEGQSDWESLQTTFSELQEANEKDEASDFVTDNLEEIYETHYKAPGLRWRLNAMNRMLGSLRQGDFGCLFARPETGKTTFLSSEVTFMAAQLPTDRPVIWFNNEQVGAVVKSYLYRSALGKTIQEIIDKRQESMVEYLKVTNKNIKVVDNPMLAKKDIERICAQYNPGLIIFDQIDKIKGFAADRDDLALGEIYQWARGLASRYCPVIGVSQAGESGANKKYLTMEDMVNAKTSKQAEADWILGIGKLNQEGWEDVRHLHLSKNKLTGDPDTDPTQRHGKCDVLIRAAIARYEDA
jgi:replicative DNA helicase